MTTLYLDACCLNRPFDDQTQPRVHLEAEAILVILTLCQAGAYEWLVSSVLDLEIDQIQDIERRSRIRSLASNAHRSMVVQTGQEARSKELVSMGLHTFDALHLACAESGGADVFLTTDDRLLRQAARMADRLHVRVENPLTWVKEVTTN